MMSGHDNNNNNNPQKQQRSVSRHQAWGELDDSDEDSDVIDVSTVPVHFEGNERAPRPATVLGRRARTSRRPVYETNEPDTQVESVNDTNAYTAGTTNSQNSSVVSAAQVVNAKGMARRYRLNKPIPNVNDVEKGEISVSEMSLAHPGETQPPPQRGTKLPPAMVAQRIGRKLVDKARVAKERKKKKSQRAEMVRQDTLVVKEPTSRPSNDMLKVLEKYLKRNEDILWCERRSGDRVDFVKKRAAVVCFIILVPAIVVLSLEPNAFSAFLFGFCLISCIVVGFRCWDEVQKLNATFYAITTKAAIIGHVRYTGLCDTPIGGVDHRMKLGEVQSEHVYIVRGDRYFSMPGDKVVYYEEGSRGRSEIIPRGFDGVCDAESVLRLLRRRCGFTDEASDDKDTKKKKKKKKKKRKKTSARHDNSAVVEIPNRQF